MFMLSLFVFCECFFFFFFFFQAEDGIRDTSVTGVQTCALPICQLLSEEDYLRAQEEYGQDNFTAKIGAEAISEMLKGLELEKLDGQLRADMAGTDSDIKRKKLAK